MVGIFSTLGLLCAGILSGGLRAAPAAAKTQMPRVPPFVLRQAPSFVLPDLDGHRRALADFRGRPVALYFFCGCSWCRQCAQAWGQFQRGGSLAPRLGAPAPGTVVVFSGGAGEARAFLAQTGLDPRQTALLLDPALRVTEDLYRAEPCPRVFVLDSRGRPCYTNTHSDDAPRTAPALAIASRVLTALRACEAVRGPRTQGMPRLLRPALSEVSKAVVISLPPRRIAALWRVSFGRATIETPWDPAWTACGLTWLA